MLHSQIVLCVKSYTLHELSSRPLLRGKKGREILPAPMINQPPIHNFEKYKSSRAKKSTFFFTIGWESEKKRLRDAVEGQASFNIYETLESENYGGGGGGYSFRY